MVLAVLAGADDDSGAALVRRWSAYDARLLTSADLSRPGWVVPDRGARESTAVVGGEPVRAADLAGVLVRVASIEGAELTRIVPADRDYCAAEMTAFLTWWLSGLPCPVVNRPTARSLAGPGWRPAGWHLTAQRLGVRSAAPRWRAGVPPDAHPGAGQPDGGGAGVGTVEVVTVVAGTVVGSPDGVLAAAAVGLARAAGVAALAVGFDPGSDPPGFLWAEPWVDVCDPDVADALLDTLLGAGR